MTARTRRALRTVALAAVAGAVAWGCASGSDSSSYCWTVRAPLPTPRAFHALVAVDRELYAIGGYSGAVLARVDRYDPAVDAWTRVADMQSPRAKFAAGVIDGKIYVACGLTFDDLSGAVTVSTTEVYDPATGTWTFRAPCPLFGGGSVEASTIAGAVAGGRLYVTAIGVGGAPTTHAYDPATDTWSTRAAQPTTNPFHSVAGLGGSVYLLTGAQLWSGAPGQLVRYDPAGDAWASRATEAGVVGATLVAHRGAIYALGGSDWVFGQGTRAAVSDVSRYDPLADAWSESGRLARGRVFAAAASDGGTVYVAGGSSSGEYRSIALLDLVEASSSPWCPSLTIPRVRFP